MLVIMDSNESSEQLLNCMKNNEKEVYKRELHGIESKTDTNSSRSDQIPSTSGITNGPQFRHLSSNSYNENGSNSYSVPLLKTSENNTILSDINMPCDENVLTSKAGNESGSSDEDEVELVNIEKLSCQRYKPCHDKSSTNDYDFNVPSTSSTTMACKIDNVKGNISNFKDSTKRPSNLRLNRSNVEADASSSDTGNDDYSLGSEDGCIYTYRGGEHLADLPSSFFSLDMGLPLDKHLPVPPHYRMRQEGVVINNPGRASRASSPDMDFLEMDFDPGPSCEADTGDKSSPEEGSDVSGQMPDEIPPPIREDTPIAEPNLSTEQVPLESVSYNEVMQNNEDINVASSTNKEERSDENIVPEASNNIYGPYITHINFRGERLLVRRSTSSCAPAPILNLHNSGGDVVSLYKKEESEAMWELHQSDQRDRFTLNNSNLASVLYHQTMAKKLMVEKEKGDFVDGGDSSNLSCEVEMSSEGEDNRLVEVSRNMVWSEQEACERQVVQMGASTCGVVAVINAFLALGIPVDTEKIKSAIAIRQRHNDAPLVRYLLSRTVAGCTAAELVSGIQRASDGLVTARFFSMYPERAMSLSHWLADWISIGAVPIATLNLQAGCEGDIPDAWHHQMIFGVSPRGVFLCNPVECVPETTLWPRLRSPSTLLVRTRDVLSRFAPCTDLTPLMHVPDERFHTYNVFGQVVNVIREWRAVGWSEERTRTRHVRIPASYESGVTVAALVGSEAHWRLTHAPQLPTLSPHVKTDI